MPRLLSEILSKVSPTDFSSLIHRQTNVLRLTNIIGRRIGNLELTTPNLWIVAIVDSSMTTEGLLTDILTFFIVSSGIHV